MGEWIPVTERLPEHGFVAAIIQTDSMGKVAGIRHQDQDDFPPNELIPLYLCPQVRPAGEDEVSDTNYSDFVDVCVLLGEAHAKIRKLEAEIDCLRLTDEWREAVEYVCRNVLPDGSREGDDALHLLRMLLRRTK